MNILKNRGLLLSCSILICLVMALFAMSTFPSAMASSTETADYETRIQELEKRVTSMQVEIDNLKTQINSTNSTQTNLTNDTKEPIKPQQPSVPEESKVPNVPTTSVPQSTNTKITAINTKITEPSGLSVAEIDALLTKVLTVKYKKSNSKLLGQGAAFKKLETDYGVNAVFAIAIASHETGWGCTGVASKNNLFAFRGKSGYKKYDNVSQSIDAFGKNIRPNYFNKGLTTISKISSKYCPPNSKKWTKDVTWFFNLYAKEANIILQS